MSDHILGHFRRLAKKRKSSQAVGKGSEPGEKKGWANDLPAPIMTSEPTLDAPEFSLSLADNSRALVVVSTQQAGGLEATGECRQEMTVPPVVTAAEPGIVEATANHGYTPSLENR